MNSVLGRFCWHDLITTDIDAGIAFYQAVVGWTAKNWDGGGKPYPILHTPEDTGVGGVGLLPDQARAMGAPPHWMAHISTPYLGDTVGRAQTLGGRVVVPPTSIPTVGAFAILTDPQGNTFGAFQALADTPGHDGPAKLGEFVWHELITADPDAAWDFYSELFGWQKSTAMDMGPMGTYQIFRAGGGDVGAVMRTPDDMPTGGWLHYAHVADTHAAVAVAQRLGATLLNGPMSVPGGDFIAQLTDPQGAMFAVHSNAP